MIRTWHRKLAMEHLNSIQRRLFQAKDLNSERIFIFIIIQSCRHTKNIIVQLFCFLHSSPTSQILCSDDTRYHTAHNAAALEPRFIYFTMASKTTWMKKIYIKGLLDSTSLITKEKNKTNVSHSHDLAEACFIMR